MFPKMMMAVAIFLYWKVVFIDRQVVCQTNEVSNKSTSCSVPCSCCISSSQCNTSNDNCGSLCKEGIFGDRCLNNCPTNCIRCRNHPNVSHGDQTYWHRGYCRDCKDGFYSSSQFYQCQLNCPAECQRCNSDKECTSCKNGYTMEGTTCRQCKTGCASCTSFNYCNKCQNEYYNLGGTINNLSCITCSKGCSDLCDQTLGNCTCKLGFTGYKCDLCVDGMYGDDCHSSCQTHCTQCTSESNCTSCGNEYYLQRGTCMPCQTGCYQCISYNVCSQCMDGYYISGSNCVACPSNCTNSTCNHLDGECASCVEGIYGPKCNQSCSAQCSNKTCDRETGACSTGCISGFSGDKCCFEGPDCKTCSGASECIECVDGLYGDACSKNCSTDCEGRICEKESGRCSRCIEGFHGNFCTLVKSDIPVVVIGIAVAVFIAMVITVIIIILRPRGKTNNDVVAFTNERVYENEPDFIYLEESKNESQYVSMDNLDDPIVRISAEVARKEEKGTPIQTEVDDYHDQQQPGTSSHDHPIYSQSKKMAKKSSKTDQVPGAATVPALSGNIEKTGNDYYNNCDSTTGLDVKDFATYVEQKSRVFFQSEFQMLPKGLIKPSEDAMKDHNVGKNRYNGICPYDETRVILHGPGSDFINASYIEGFHRRREYIASFGPIAKATEGFRTFWRMVWQEQTEKIVMVTNLTERAGMKCEKYWPDVNKTQQYGDVRVTCHSEDIYAEYTIRSFTVKKGKQRRSLQHIHYSAWRDKGVPDDVTSLVEFRNKVNSTNVTLGGPVIIHCSAGVGRTGTYIALDILTYKGKRIGKVDIFDCVEKLRQQRTGMVQTPDQYEYIYRALVHTLTLGSEAIRAETFRSYLSSVTEHDMEASFETMCNIKEKISNEEREAVVKNTREFKHLNRDGADIPGNSNRLQLFLGRTDEDNNYINAVYVNSFKLKNQFIMTQTPLPTSVNDFLTLVVQTDCSCIVSMDPIECANKDIGSYLPADNQVLRSESFEVTSTKLKSNNSYSLRRLVIKAKLMGNLTTCTVHHFQCTNWPGTSTRPTSTESFLQIVNEVVTTAEESMSFSPIIVHCVTGAERSGLLCVVVSLLQKMEIEHEVSVINTVRQVKVRRPKAIPNKEQFMFCHECVAAYLQTFDIYSNFS